MRARSWSARSIARPSCSCVRKRRVDWSENVYDKTFDSNAGKSDFEPNLIRFRAKLRAKLAVTRPAGFVQVAVGS